MQPQHIHDSTTVAGATASPADAATTAHTSGTPAPAGATAEPGIADDIVDKLRAVLRGRVKGTKSPYLEGKGLSDFATAYRVATNGTTVIPLVDASNIIVAFQTISANGGEKLFAGKTKGAFHIINQQEQPERIIIAEGLATTLSVHQLQRDAMTVMAGSAHNLEAVARTMRERHPEAEIIIAADNDNDGKSANTGKVNAEKAACAVGGTVALAPAEDGGKRDWNDVLVSEGRKTAAMLFAGSIYQPAATGKTDRRKSRRSARDSATGVVVEDTDDGPMMRLRLHDTSLDICQKVDVVGYGTYKGKSYRVLQWMTHGERVTVAVDLGGFASGAALTALMSKGLVVRDGKAVRSALTNWILGQNPTTCWMLAGSAGWHGNVYLLPDGQHIGAPESTVLFMGNSAAAGGYTSVGTVESWRREVASLAEGNPIMMVSVAVAFAAPLIGLAEGESFGLHLFGPSSSGKTTCAALAGSVVGRPDKLKLSWNATALGVQNEAAARCDCLLWLDELQDCRPEVMADAIYSLINGTGRIMASRDGGNLERPTWRTAVISTGETDTESLARLKGIQLNPGQLIRLLNIPITQPENFHGHASARAHADALRAACGRNYGAVFRAWMVWLIQHQDEARNTVDERRKVWCEAVVRKFSESPQIGRVASVFAVLEAALILTRQFTCWDVSACQSAVRNVFALWVKDFGTYDKAQDQLITQAEDFLTAHGYSNFATLTTDGRANAVTEQEASRIRRLYGYRKPAANGDDEWFYVAPGEFRKHIAKGHNAGQAAAALARAGLLERGRSGDSWQRSLRINGKLQRFYKMRLPDKSGG